MSMRRLPNRVRDLPTDCEDPRQQSLPFPTDEQLAASAAIERAVERAGRRHDDTSELERLGAHLIKIMGRAR